MLFSRWIGPIGASVILLLGCGGGGGGSTAGPAPPTGVVVQAGSTFDQVTLRWNAVAGVDSYTVDVSRNGGVFATIPGSLSGSATSTPLVFDPSLFPEAVQVGFRVIAHAGGKASEPSNTAVYSRGLRSAWSLSATPSASDGTIRVDVTQGTALASTLTIERQPLAGGAWVAVHSEPCAGGSGLSVRYNDGDLQEGVAYVYRATYAAGTFTSTPTLSGSAQVNLLPPVGLTLTAEPAQVHLCWTNRSARATGLSLVRTDNFGSGIAVPIPVTATEYVYAPSEITPLFLTLRVDDGAGNTATSMEVSGAPLPPPGALPVKLELVALPNWSRMIGSAVSPSLLSANSSWPYTPKILLPGENEYQGAYLSVDSVSDFRLDASNRPAFAGLSRTASVGQYTIRYGYRDGAAVPTEDVCTEGLDPAFANPHLALEPTGQPHLLWKSFSDGTGGTSSILKHATKANGAWAVETLQSDAMGPMDFGCTSDGTLWLVTWASQQLQLGAKAPGQAWVWTVLPINASLVPWLPPVALAVDGNSFSLLRDGLTDSIPQPPVVFPISLALRNPVGSASPLGAAVDLQGTGNLRVFAAAAAKGRLAMVVGSYQYASTYPWLNDTLTLIIRNADGQMVSTPLGTMTTVGSGMALLFDDAGKVHFFFNTGYHQGLGAEKVLTLAVSE